jgi:hypothetical protein
MNLSRKLTTRFNIRDSITLNMIGNMDIERYFSNLKLYLALNIGRTMPTLSFDGTIFSLIRLIKISANGWAIEWESRAAVKKTLFNAF